MRGSKKECGPANRGRSGEGVETCIEYRRQEMRMYTRRRSLGGVKGSCDGGNGMTLRVWLGGVVLCTSYAFMVAGAQPGNTAAPAAPASAGRIGATLQPSVQLVKEALGSLNIDKWKASTAIKSDADAKR